MSITKEPKEVKCPKTQELMIIGAYCPEVLLENKDSNLSLEDLVINEPIDDGGTEIAWNTCYLLPELNCLIEETGLWSSNSKCLESTRKRILKYVCVDKIEISRMCNDSVVPEADHGFIWSQTFPFPVLQQDPLSCSVTLHGRPDLGFSFRILVKINTENETLRCETGEQLILEGKHRYLEVDLSTKSDVWQYYPLNSDVVRIKHNHKVKDCWMFYVIEYQGKLILLIL